MITIGIDPGLTGAISFLNPMRAELEVFDMPRDLLNEKMLDIGALSRIIKSKNGSSISRVIIERVHAMPHQGVSSMFNFGVTYGGTLATLTLHNLPVVTVEPAVWKTNLGLGRDKDKSLALAIELFPNYAKLFSRKKDNGRAEATLLAYYGCKRFG